ncbi:MAG: hypothetical protein GQ525_15340 [Draconibacterium sp.]|nr:hypothetical protein [Draconibacterium sp.]
MKIDNKINRTFSGPSIFLGITFLVIGIVALINKGWIQSSISLTIASFLLLSYSGVEIDTKKRLIKSYNKYFGLLKAGKWKPIDNYLGVTLVPMKKINTIYSRSNRINSSTIKEFKIHLVNKAKKPALAIKKCKTEEFAQSSLDEFAVWLKLPVFSILN